jgi:hypothetical protein
MPSARSPVRISESAKRTLRDLAARDGTTMQSVLDRAVEAYRRQRFLEEANSAFQILREEGAGWEDELRERREWDAATPERKGRR